jgi:hypothetical protein
VRRTVQLAVLVALLVTAAVPARAQQSGLGPASSAALRSVAKAPTTKGVLNPGRAATVLARMFRAGGDDPRQIACSMSSPDTATCLLSIQRNGVGWTGTGKVWQGHHAFRASYEISTSA